jgi:hypothetical protein
MKIDLHMSVIAESVRGLESNMTRRFAIDRRIVLSGLVFGAATANSSTGYGLPSKTIDRRVRSEPRAFGLTFAAELPNDVSQSGHAFIVWQREDDAKRMSVAEAIGFYPTGEPKTFTLIFGTAGELETDISTPADLKLAVLLNNDLYQRALEQKNKWQTNGKYRALWNNCVTHVADIAHSIGLVSSDGKWETPQAYVRDLIDRNN